MAISFSEFKKVQMKVGKVIDAERVEGSEKLIKMIVDFGTEKRQAIAGIAKWYGPGELIGKKFVFVINLEPKKMMGLESQAMILAAMDEEGNLALVTLDKPNIKEGSPIS
ncbi:MAG: methionine--tRNA ligase subunit beta [Candidatus Aenigmarchaeota archaeon]|nr:methionine--tRNA ligase subunit beta [Candidatus Aenigmarchaeota archaeon]